MANGDKCRDRLTKVFESDSIQKMNERGDGSGEEIRGAAIFINPIEEIVDRSGNRGIIAEGMTLASDDEMARMAEEMLSTETGARKLTKDEQSRSFFFSSKNWHAPWEPQGPKPNWRQEPLSGPSLN